MELEINTKHKGARFNSWTQARNKFVIPFLGASISVLLFSGCANNLTREEAKPTYDITLDDLEKSTGKEFIQIDDGRTFVLKGTVEDDKSSLDEYDGAVHKIVDGDDVVEVSGRVAHEVARYRGVPYSRDMTLTKQDFNYIESYYTDSYDEDLSWTKYCGNLETVYLRGKGDMVDNSTLATLASVPSLKTFGVYGSQGNNQFNSSRFGWIKDSSIANLQLTNVSCSDGFVEGLTNLSSLKVNDGTTGINYSALSFLDNFEIHSYSLPDILSSFEFADYEALTSSGVSVVIGDRNGDNISQKYVELASLYNEENVNSTGMGSK